MSMEDEESLFDDFGNYIGPLASAPPPEEATTLDQDIDGQEQEGTPSVDEESPPTSTSKCPQQIVLHEEKKYYLSAEEVYGPQVETLVQDEDTQPLSEPIIAAPKTRRFQHEGSLQMVDPIYDAAYLASVLWAAERIRGVAIVGHLHAGKTSLIDVLLASTHRGLAPPERGMARYLDSLYLENSREISLKAKPITLLAGEGDAHSPSMVLNLMDTPGHLGFSDEQAASLRLVDGVVIVVDVVDGCMAGTEAAIKKSLQAGLPVILLINKIERLFLELKLPPTDAYYKLRHIIEEINTFVASLGGEGLQDGSKEASSWFSPEKGNVLFASTLSGLIFSLHSFAALYLRRQGEASPSKTKALACRLWGDVFYQRETGKFWRGPVEGASKRTFVTFVLEPLYKIYGAVLTEERETLQATLAETLGVSLKASECVLNIQTVLRKVFAAWLGVTGSADALTSAIKSIIPDPRESAFGHVLRYGIGSGEMSRLLQSCDPKGPLVAFASKTYPKGDASQFETLARIFSGTIRVGQAVRIVGDAAAFSSNDNALIVKSLQLAGPRCRIPIMEAPAGALVLIGGIEQALSKCATILGMDAEAFAFAPLSLSPPLIRVAIEPVVPAEHPKMIRAIGHLTKTYPQLVLRIEDSGEHALMGPDELYLDCVLHDLRHLYTADANELEVRVADPVTRLAETVAEGSYLKCHARTPNGRNRITFIAEPLERSVVKAMEDGRLPDPQRGPEHARELSLILQRDHGWDILAARSVWAFDVQTGSDSEKGASPTLSSSAMATTAFSSCVLIDDTLPGETDKETLQLVSDLIIQGFQWACKEGPLCEEPIRGVRFRLVEATICPEVAHRPAGQLIPTVRRACHAALLTASPRLMEPVLRVQIQSIADFVEALYQVLATRRGHVTRDTPRAGTPLHILDALVPLMDSFGLESDLRINSQGMAYIQSSFDHWQIVSGDPLDASIKLIPLEPASAPQLARDYLMKTRRRKGLGEDVRVAKFFDEEMLASLAREEALSGIKGLQI